MATTTAAGVVDLAGVYGRTLTETGNRLAILLSRLWQASVDPADPAASWAAALPEAVAAFTAGQLVAAGMADPYTSQILAGQGLTPDPAGAVDPAAFAGQAATGLALDDLLQIPADRAAVALRAGAPQGPTLQAAQSLLARYAKTEIADAGRLSTQVAGTARGVTGYYRALRPPSCARCAILAGRYYRWSSGFSRHPNCFPDGVVVSGPATQAAARRWYEGELVRLVTSRGKHLALTGNHPVLTRRGWVPAHLLQEGDEVVSGSGLQTAGVGQVPDHHQVPALIEDVWGALRVLGVDQVPARPEHFHGDGQQSEVHVVRADGSLSLGSDAAGLQHLVKEILALASSLAFQLKQQGSASLGDVRDAAETARLVRAACLVEAGLRGHLAGSHLAGLARSTALELRCLQYSTDHIAADAVLHGQTEFARTGEVGGGDLTGRQVVSAPARWDAPAGPLTEENRAGYASRGVDLLERFTGRVELERLVDVARVQWSGHVYSLTSTEGWHQANSLIVSNCDCMNVPAPDDRPDLLFDPRRAVLDGQVHGLSAAETQAITLGASPSQVVNARAGMYVAGGQTFTTTGTTTQGVAGARLLARSLDRAQGAPAGAVYRNFTVPRVELAQSQARYEAALRRGNPFTRSTAGGRTQTYAYRYARAARPSVSTILRTAKDQDDAIRLLINNGYIY